MNESKKSWIIGISVSVLVAAGLGALIYFQRQSLDERRQEVETLTATIEKHSELIKGTPDLIKQVIVQRETDEVIKEILSDEEDVNNLVRTLQTIGEDTGVSITSLKPRTARARAAGAQDFEQVGYTLNFDAEGFQFMSFLDRIESQPRFMSITAFKLSGAPRSTYDGDSEPKHRVQLDLETYVYRPTTTAEAAKIDQYQQRRDLLVSEISRRTAELKIERYDYQGQRARRDPWIDPRIEVNEGPVLSIEEQFEIVDRLIDHTLEAETLVEDYHSAGTVIEQMKARAALEEKIAYLDEEIRRVQTQGLLVFVSAVKRFESQVVDVVGTLREEVERTSEQGPSLAKLKQAIEGMERHISAQEYEIALEVFATVEPGLPLAERDPPKLPYVQALRELAALTETVLEFEAIELSIDGVAIYEDLRPVALINGRPVSEGELVEGELIVRNITPEQIEFSYRGLVIARVVEDSAF